MKMTSDLLVGPPKVRSLLIEVFQGRPVASRSNLGPADGSTCSEGNGAQLVLFYSLNSRAFAARKPSVVISYLPSRSASHPRRAISCAMCRLQTG